MNDHLPPGLTEAQFKEIYEMTNVLMKAVEPALNKGDFRAALSATASVMCEVIAAAAYIFGDTNEDQIVEAAKILTTFSNGAPASIARSLTRHQRRAATRQRGGKAGDA